MAGNQKERTAYEWEKYLDNFRYTETDSAGQTFEIFAYYTAGHCVIDITNRDGTMQKFYTSDAKVLYDLKDYNDKEQFTEWFTIGPHTPEHDKEQQIRVSCRLGGRMLDFGTDHMPDRNGLEKLHTIRDMLLGATNEDNEIKAFTVTINGKQYRTIAGTGNIVGTGAIIDFGDDKWWQIEHFQGHYELTKASLEKTPQVIYAGPGLYDNASVDILEDGSLRVVVNDSEFTGSVDMERGWQVRATALRGEMTMYFEDENPPAFTINAKKYVPSFLHIFMRNEPYPGTFVGFDVVVERVKKR